MKVFVLAAAIFISGCNMTNEEVISEAKKCEDAGMAYQIHRKRLNGKAYYVSCEKPSPTTKSK